MAVVVSYRVASTVLDAFAALPQKYKPRPTEWVPLSGVVMEKSGYFLLEECRKLSTEEDYISEYIYLSTIASQRFEIRPEVRIHFYSSEAPCGDGSMELTMASQTDSTPWALPPSQIPTSVTPSKDTPAIHLRGRGYFSELGAVRTKPGRADSPQTPCKSCSDKLSVRQAISLLLTPTSFLISPTNAYISMLVIPSSQYSSSACIRAFGVEGRMKSLSEREWEGGYSFRPFQVATTELEFESSKRRGGSGTSNLSTVSVENRGCEALIGGVLQGRKQFSGVKAGSMLCKVNMWRRVVGISPETVGSAKSYTELKEAAICRQKVKSEVRKALGGWIRTGGDDFEMPEKKVE
ncbi:adenosine deaminase/editase [Trichophaea hybrida]|nr:adenosine deaminase/editase [Trichophaea hybrida]